jgi:uncharacterized protein
MAAARGGQVGVVKLFLEKGVDVNARNKRRETALIVAAARGHADVVKLLLDNGANINAKDESGRCALKHAVWLQGHAEVVKVLLDRGADVNAGNRTVLIHAAQRGHFEIVKLLLERGADVNAMNSRGQTALSLAGGKDVEEIQKLLKAYGAKK